MKFNFQASKALSILVLTIISITRIHAQITDDAITDIVNSGQVIEVRDESYRENSKEFVKVLNFELVDLSEKTYDLSWSKLLKVKTVLRNEKLIAKSIKKNILTPSIDYRFSLYSSETYTNQINQKIAKGKLSYDKDFLNLSEITWITEGVEWEKAVNRVGYSVTYSTGQTNHDALVLKLNKQWLVFNLSDTLKANKEMVRIEYEAIQYRNKRNTFITQLNKDYSSDLTRFFKDTSIYIFEVPRCMISYNNYPVQQFSDSLEFVTYQITNDSLWFMNTFKSDTTDRSNYRDPSYSSKPVCIAKVKLQDVYASTQPSRWENGYPLSASGGINLSEAIGSKLYDMSWSGLEYKARNYPEKYAKAIDAISNDTKALVDRIEKSPTEASKIRYTDYESIYTQFPLSEFSRDLMLRFDVSSDDRLSTLGIEFELGDEKDKIWFKPYVYGEDSTVFEFCDKSYNRRFDTFVPFKTKPFVNNTLLNGGAGYFTVSDTINAQKLSAILLHTTVMDVVKKKLEREKQEAETSERFAKLSAKYGAKYAKAYMNMSIIVGMPKELAENLIQSFYSVDDYSQYGSSRTYYLTSLFNSASKLTVTINEKGVSSLHSF